MYECKKCHCFWKWEPKTEFCDCWGKYVHVIYDELNDEFIDDPYREFHENKKDNRNNKKKNKKNNEHIENRNEKKKNKFQNYFHIRNLRVWKKEYVVTTIKNIIIRWLLYWIISKINNIWIIITYFTAFFFFCLIDYIVMTIWRLHDISKNWRLILIPWYNIILRIILLCKNWQIWNNKYWEDPNKIKIRFLRLDILKLLAVEAKRIATDTTAPESRDTMTQADLHSFMYSWTFEFITPEQKAIALKDSIEMSATFFKLYNNRYQRDENNQYELENSLKNYYIEYHSWHKVESKIDQKFSQIKKIFNESVVPLGAEYNV